MGAGWYAQRSEPEGPMNKHLSTTTIQALLDTRLSREERLVAEGHLGSCERCRTELARWTSLFGTLSELPALAPTPALKEGVRAGIRGTRPLVSPAEVPGPVSGWHPTPEELLDRVDGMAPASAAARVGQHLEACTACSADVKRWEGLFAAITALPLHAPSDGFRERVLARVPAAQPRTLRGQLRLVAARTGATLSRVRPRGWAALAGVATAPAAAAVMIVWSLFSNPMVSVSALASYAWWKAVGLAGVVGAPLVERLAAVDTNTLSAFFTPLTVVVSFVLLASLAGLSFWTLYRNLFSQRTSGGSYA